MPISAESPINADPTSLCCSLNAGVWINNFLHGCEMPMCQNYAETWSLYIKDQTIQGKSD